MRRLAVVQRGDQGLNDRSGAVEGPGIAPGFEEVSLGNVPGADLGGLVHVQAKPDRERDLLDGLGEFEVDRRRVNRIPAKDQERLDLTGLHVLDQLGQRRQVVDRVGLDRLDKSDGPFGPDAPDRLVDRDPDRVDISRLGVANQNQARLARLLEILADGGGPLGLGLRQLARSSTFDADLLGHGQGEVYELARLDRQTMVGRGPGVGVGRFGGVEPVHGPRLGRPLGGEGSFVGGPAGGAAGEEVGVEREDHVGLVEVVDGVHHLAKGELRPGLGRVLADRLVTVPLGFGEGGEQFLDLTGQAGRADGLGQDPEPGAFPRPEEVHLLGQPGQEVVIGKIGVGAVAVRLGLKHDLGAVRVIEAKRGGLSEDVGRAKAGRVVGVAFDLGRPAGVTLDQEAAVARPPKVIAVA